MKGDRKFRAQPEDMVRLQKFSKTINLKWTKESIGVYLSYLTTQLHRNCVLILFDYIHLFSSTSKIE
jgi:hypothetical protein